MPINVKQQIQKTVSAFDRFAQGAKPTTEKGAVSAEKPKSPTTNQPPSAPTSGR